MRSFEGDISAPFGALLSEEGVTPNLRVGSIIPCPAWTNQPHSSHLSPTDTFWGNFSSPQMSPQHTEGLDTSSTMGSTGKGPPQIMRGQRPPCPPPQPPRLILWESLLPLGLSSPKVGVTPKSPLLLHVGGTTLTMTTSGHEVTLTPIGPTSPRGQRSTSSHEVTLPHVCLKPRGNSNGHLVHLS